jgi:hypothetical protein
MSNINLRTYGNMIYGNISKYLTEYIEPDINKDEFIEMFNKGKLNVDNLKLKNGKNFIIDSKFKLSFFSCKIFEAMIPDENSNLEIYIKDAKISINLIELNYDNLEAILISEIKSFTDNYINYAIQKVQNKDNAPSMIEGMIQNIILKIINNDFKFEIKNIEISLKFNDIILIFSIDKIQFNKEEIKIEKNKDVEMKKEEYKEEDKQNDININPNNDLKENINPNEIILTKVSPFRKLFGVSLLQEGYLLGPSPDIKPKIFIPKIYIKSMEEQEYKLLIYYFKGITLFMFLKNDINIDLIQFNQIKEIIKKILSNELINEMEKSHKQINELFNIFSVNSSDKSFKISGIFSKNNREINYFLQKILFVNNNVFLNSLTYFKGGYNFKGGYIYYLNSIGRKVVFILNDSLSINQIRSEIDKNEKECDFIFLI